MTVTEIRLVAVFAIIAIGALALLVSLALTHLLERARHLKSMVARRCPLPSSRGDARDAARLIDRPQAASRLRC